MAERLKQAATDGRIVAHEFEERLAAALRARTYGDLDAVVADLPANRMVRKSPARTRELAMAHPFTAAAVAAVGAVMLVMIAAIVLASLAVLSGVFLVAALAMMHGRGSRHSRRPPGGYLPGSPGGRAGGRPRNLTRSVWR